MTGNQCYHGWRKSEFAQEQISRLGTPLQLYIESIIVNLKSSSER